MALTMSFFELSDNIVEGSGAIIIGYPLRLGSEFTGNKPISKIGIIAQEPNPNTNTFLLDCMANPGNSGSPVFQDEPLMLIGMVTSYKPDNISLYDSEGLLKANLPYNSGITICVTAEIIQKIIP